MKSAELIGKAKSLDILLALQKDKLTFGRIKEITGNATTASRRLKEMLKLGIIKRDFIEDKLGTVEYRITKKGRKIISLIDELNKLDK